ncbi:MAG TPA: DUF5335 family protein [Thermoanaerobaculia bacterium]
MDTHTISPPQWKTTFDSLSRIYDGASASLEVLTPDLGAQYEIENQPLRGISYDKSGIELHFTTRDGQHLVHRIADPKQVQIEESDDGLVAAVGIESAGKLRSVLHFSAPKASRLLGGH